MLLSSVILVLREFLEAALLFSLLLVFSRWLRLSFQWVTVALCAGMLGAVIYGANIALVSEWFEGVGQEVVNATLQLGIYGLLAIFAAACARHLRVRPVSPPLLYGLMTAAVALAITREGSEIMIYLSGFLMVRDQLVPVLAGSAIGAGIGISTGAVFYFLLSSFTRRVAVGGGLLVLALVAGGMVAQAVQLLVQADWLPSLLPVWDSSWLVAEDTVTGQVLYALVGYEATPSMVQLTAYAAAMAVYGALVVTLGFAGRARRMRAEAG